MGFGICAKKAYNHQYPSKILPHFAIIKKVKNSFAEFVMVEVHREP
jgi:hypothetical protein